MTELNLPFHPRTGLQAIGFRRNGEPIWPVLGGSGEGDDEPETDVAGDGDDADTSDGTAEGGDKPDDTDDADSEDKPLGPAGEKALNAEKEKRRTEAAKRRAAEKERDDAKAELDKLRRAAERAKAKPAAAKPAEPEPDREEIDPEEIKREAEAKAITVANERIVKAEIRASAAGRLADPKDALKFLDLSKFEVDADGNVDTDEIDDAIADLLKEKPYLAVAQGESKRFKGSGDGGAKPNKPARPKSLGEAIVRRYTK